MCCVVTVFTPLSNIESNKSKCCPALRMRSPCRYITILFFKEAVIRSFFRLGLSMGFSKLEFLGQIAPFERRLRGVAPTPLALPYPFRTST